MAKSSLKMAKPNKSIPKSLLTALSPILVVTTAMKFVVGVNVKNKPDL
ncbi:MAG: hypothetical protein HC778_01340 [Chamaesiphon sp. CSU_1_12]|nr:hypothetical protein [Chamaesiphon sp. CSU_1_12]